MAGPPPSGDHWAHSGGRAWGNTASADTPGGYAAESAPWKSLQTPRMHWDGRSWQAPNGRPPAPNMQAPHRLYGHPGGHPGGHPAAPGEGGSWYGWAPAESWDGYWTGGGMPTFAPPPATYSSSFLHGQPTPHPHPQRLPQQPPRGELPMRRLVLLRGLPGSGKSTLARQIAAESNGIVLSTDDYFEREDGYRFDPRQLGDAHEWNKKRAQSAMHEGRPTICIDNTNLQAWEMRPYIEMGRAMGYTVEIAEAQTPWANDPAELARRNTHRVPEDKIHQMAARYVRGLSVEDALRDGGGHGHRGRGRGGRSRDGGGAGRGRSDRRSPHRERHPHDYDRQPAAAHRTQYDPSPHQAYRAQDYHDGLLRRRSGRFLVVLDINGVLIDRQRQTGDQLKRPNGKGADFVTNKCDVFLRPHVVEFCTFLLDNFEVVVWSSMMPHNITALLPKVFGARESEIRAVLDQRDCATVGTMPSSRGGSKPRFAKPLDKVWRRLGEGPRIDPRTTLLIDDDAYKATYNPPFTSIHPPAYDYMDSGDNVLQPEIGALWKFLSRLTTATDVPSCVETDGAAVFVPIKK